MIVIDSFRGEYRFLSNFYSCIVVYKGVAYASVEHAYQSAKTKNLVFKSRIMACSSAAQAKKLGEEAPLRKEWDETKVEVMRELVRIKFSKSGLKKKLLETNDTMLIEGNYWKDEFWGVCNGKGENWLGKILMEIRDQLKEERCLKINDGKN